MGGILVHRHGQSDPMLATDESGETLGHGMNYNEIIDVRSII